MKFLSLVLCSIVLISCGASVAVDYDTTTDFTTQKTFQFSNAHTNRFKEPLNAGVNPFDTKRIESAITSSLTEKQWQQTDYNQFYIDFYVEQFASGQRNTIGVGVGSGGGGISVGGGVGIPIGPRKIEHFLTIEFRNASNEGVLVWEGKLSGLLRENETPEQKEAFYTSLVNKILSKFPPKNQQ